MGPSLTQSGGPKLWGTGWTRSGPLSGSCTSSVRGTLNRLDLFLARLRTPDEQRKAVLKPLRDVRSARAKPAHAIRKNISDADFVRRQAEVLSEVTESVHLLRKLWAKHPRNSDWS